MIKLLTVYAYTAGDNGHVEMQKIDRIPISKSSMLDAEHEHALQIKNTDLLLQFK